MDHFSYISPLHKTVLIKPERRADASCSTKHHVKHIILLPISMSTTHSVNGLPIIIKCIWPIQASTAITGHSLPFIHYRHQLHLRPSSLRSWGSSCFAFCRCFVRIQNTQIFCLILLCLFCWSLCKASLPTAHAAQARLRWWGKHLAVVPF